MKKLQMSLFVVALTLRLHGAVVVNAGYTRPTPVYVAPGQIVTFYIQGIGASLIAPISATSLPLPFSLGGISAEFIQGVFAAPIPILSVKPVSPCANTAAPRCRSVYIAIRVQIPFGFDYSDPTVSRGAPVQGGQIQFTENGAVAASVDVTPFSDQVHVLRSCDDLLYDETSCSPLATHSDGSVVELRNPAKSGEEIVIYAVGLGIPASSIAAGEAPEAPIPTRVSVSFDPRPNALGSRPVLNSLSEPVFAGLVSGYVGLYQINVLVPMLPSGTPPCDGTATGVSSNLTVSIVGHSSFDGARICVTR